jgi:hypothetical protein
MADVDLRVRLDNVRLSWPHIAEPQIRKYDDGQDKNPQYNAEFILTPDHPAWDRYHKVVAHVAEMKWPGKSQGILQMLQMERRNRKWGWGQEKIQKSTMQPYPSYAGMVFIGAASERMPKIFDGDGNLIPPTNTMACKELARKMYGGCRVNAVVKPWGWNNKQGGSGISNDFLAIQFLADDEPFGEGQSDTTDLMGATPQAQVPAAPAWGPPGGAPAMPAPPTWGPPQMPGAPVAQPWMR